MSEEKKETITEASGAERQEESVSATKETGKEVKKGGKGLWVLLLLVAVAAVLFGLKKFGASELTDGSDATKVDTESAVAMVYDVTITRGELDEKMEQVKLSMAAEGFDPSQDATFELQLLEDLVDLELLKRAADAKNYTVSDDEVDAEVATIIEQFPSEEEFYAQLESVGIDENELRENIETEIHIRRLLDDETDIDTVEVTDQEIEDVYTASVGDAEGMPALEEVSEIIRAQLINEKSAGIVSAYVQQLREDAGESVNITL